MATMQPDDIEPLAPGHWLRRMAQLATRSLDEDDDLERALRHAFHLVRLAPRPLRHIIRAEGDEAEFEALLDARNFEAAVLRLLGEHTPYTLHTWSDGGVSAQAWYPAQRDRHSATGRSAAAALLRAWLQCNAALALEDGAGSLARSPGPTPGQTATRH